MDHAKDHFELGRISGGREEGPLSGNSLQWQECGQVAAVSQEQATPRTLSTLTGVLGAGVSVQGLLSLLWGVHAQVAIPVLRV